MSLIRVSQVLFTLAASGAVVRSVDVRTVNVSTPRVSEIGTDGEKLFFRIFFSESFFSEKVQLRSPFQPLQRGLLSLWRVA